FQSVAQVSVTPDGKLVTRSGGAAQTWLLETADEQYARFQQADGPGTLVFQMRDGRAVRWFAPWGGEAFERLGWWRLPVTLSLLAGLTALA
ncbi:hypothetical protein, partial [Enterobacter hormaechei]